MTLKDWIAHFPDECMEREVAGAILIGLTPETPMVIATMPPAAATRLIRMIGEDADWSNVKQIRPN